MVDTSEQNHNLQSWSRKILVAAYDESLLKSRDDELIEWFGPTDNTSRQQWCTAVDETCVPCGIGDKPLWWLVLRWCKMIVFKLARSYNAKPVILMIMPLAVGLIVGYVIGCWFPLNNHDRNKAGPPQSHTTHSAQTWRLSLSNIAMAWMLGSGVERMSKDDTSTTSTTTDETSMTNSPQIQMSATQTNDSTVASQKSFPMDQPLVAREGRVRSTIKSDEGMDTESGVDPSKVPKHIAVIMDGNRRYGREKYGKVARGHWDGSAKLVEFAKWCIAENVSFLTVYAFSTENWNREPSEVAALMTIFVKYCDELRLEALQRNIKICVLSTDTSRIPSNVKAGLKRMVDETAHCEGGLTLNICLSYGSRGEIVNATRSIVEDAVNGNIDLANVNEDSLGGYMLTSSRGGDPDVLIRTSGEMRISNFMLWQLAYAELFFVNKAWPAVEKEDLLHVIRAFATGRQRRFGK